MPESFDEGLDKYSDKQGRSSKIKLPYAGEYNVKVFAARKYSRQRWSYVKIKRGMKPLDELNLQENLPGKTILSLILEILPLEM
jgi:hypothetical protein